MKVIKIAFFSSFLIGMILIAFATIHVLGQNSPFYLWGSLICWTICILTGAFLWAKDFTLHWDSEHEPLGRRKNLFFVGAFFVCFGLLSFFGFILLAPILAQTFGRHIVKCYFNLTWRSLIYGSLLSFANMFLFGRREK